MKLYNLYPDRDSHVKKGGLKYYNAASASRHGQAVLAVGYILRQKKVNNNKPRPKPHTAQVVFSLTAAGASRSSRGHP